MNNYPPFPSGAIRTPLERALTSAISNHGGNINNFSFLGSSLVTGFTGIHATGKKEGDLCIYKKTKAHSCEGVHAENNTFPILVLEIGFSENFDELRTDAAQWLDGSNRSVKAVILVKIHESTDRVHPLVLRADGEFVKTPTIHYYRPRLSENDQSELHPLSSVTYKDYRITGELRVDVEVWRPPSSE
ncbi:hypothetical protein BDN72DRAFT_345654 [Pluteus cervinus]|uniref:Uncharacterized protein n=1 Tax=Pluteus cervinus TaxID=181527 RepID=A0ACD3ABJ5_9AGAR|nr:hypothetical protein BDN72DRAFT_345654 [Pluteus cervinus]